MKHHKDICQDHHKAPLKPNQRRRQATWIQEPEVEPSEQVACVGKIFTGKPQAKIWWFTVKIFQQNQSIEFNSVSVGVR